MSVSCQALISALEKVAPKYLAEDWDNPGLLIGDPSKAINKVMVTLDCTQEVVEEAINKQVDLIIAHHPLIFAPLKQVRFDLPGQSQVAALIRHDIMFYAAHTNLDSCTIGGNKLLADRLGLTDQEFLTAGYKEQIFKVVVFVPQDKAVPVREAMSKAGAGSMGNYNECFFQTEGTGTFRPLEGAAPFIGTTGKLEQVAETKLETIVPARLLDRVVRAMLKSHPYEMPAYDIIPTNSPGLHYGLGNIGRLPGESSLGQLVQKVKEALGNCPLRVAGDMGQKIQKAALCTGSGGSLVKKAAFKGAGVFIAGDISHHDALDALAAGMAIIDPGHYATEWFMMEYLSEYLNTQMKLEKRDVEIFLSEIETEPFQFVL